MIDARGFAAECPELATLEAAPLAPEVLAHVDVCDACQLVLEVLGAAHECDRIDALIAARVDGTLARAARNLLERHLASCAGCRAVAETLSPSVDTDGDHATLPRVDPAAYALGLEVGRGGMGRILAARDLRIGRPVAVKELLGRSPQLAARFEREARVTARLQHPSIVPIYEIGLWPDGTPFYSMRLVDGGTLRAAIAAAATLGARLALVPAVIAATEAVAFAHGQRVIHRDLTPSNVLIGAYGETVVIDWGLAKDLSDPETQDEPDAGPYRSDAPGLTRAGAVIGTAAYMPPEQANAAAVDERADVYALGAILYHVLAGAAPYRDRTDILAAVKTAPPDPITDLAPRAPRDLVSIATKAMARDPAARYPSARELAEELGRFQTGRMVEAHEYTTAERMRRYVTRNRAPLVVTAIATLVFGGFGILAVSRILRERSVARSTVRTLLVDNGRSELLDGNTLRALAFLSEAYQRGDDSPELHFMLGAALREVDAAEATLDCGDDVRMIDLSPDGTRFAAACRNVGKIWRLADHALVAKLGPFPEAFDGIRYSHDGRTLATEGRDGYARTFDAETGKLRATLAHAPGQRVTWTSFTPDDALLVTTGFDGTAVVWDVATGRRIRTLATGKYYGKLTPDGTILLSASLDATGSGWNIATGEKLGELDHGGQILGADVSPDSKLACTAGANRLVMVWSLESRAAWRQLAGHTQGVWKCVFSPDGTRLLTTSNDGTAKVWDLATGALIASMTAGDIVWWGAWSSDSETIATNRLDGGLATWSARTGALLSSHDDPAGGKTARFSLDGTRLISARGDGRIRIWRHPTGALLHQLVRPEGTVIRDAVDGGARAIVERGMFGRLEIWNTLTGAPLAHESLSAPFALAGDLLAARAGDGVILVDVRDGRTVARLPLANATPVAVDRAGSRILAITAGVPQIWDVRTGRVVATLDGTAAILSDDGTRALSWREGGAPTVWDVDTGARVTTLASAGPAIKPIGFARDGTRVALHDGTDGAHNLGVWDARDGHRLVTISVANDGARFDPDGALLTAISSDQVVEVIRASDGVTLTRFVGNRLATAQVDVTGTLVVGIDERGSSVLVLGARDGRILSQRPIRQPVDITLEDFRITHGTARWSGDAIISVSTDVTVWDAHSVALSPELVAAATRAHVPWRVDGGGLVWVKNRMHGHVTRGGEPVPGATVVLAIREAPKFVSSLSWTTLTAREASQSATTDALGAYELAELSPGDYAMTARAPDGATASRTIHVSDLEEAVEIELEPPARSPSP